MLFCKIDTKILFAFVNGVFTFYILPLHSYLKIKSSGIERYLTIQSVDKPKILFLRRSRRIFRFSADMRGGKTHYKRKTAE